MDRSAFEARVFEIASPAELSGMKPPTHSLGKRLKGTLVGPTGSKIIVRAWPRGGKGAMQGLMPQFPSYVVPRVSVRF